MQGTDFPLEMFDKRMQWFPSVVDKIAYSTPKKKNTSLFKLSLYCLNSILKKNCRHNFSNYHHIAN